MANPQARAGVPAKTATTEDVIRTPFGNFTVGGRIGRGAFAQVYKAWWSEANFFVAIKAFDTSAMSQETVDSVLTEVVLLGKMKHPHILRVLGYHRAEPNLYLMLEYAENGSLLKIIKDHGALSEQNAAVFTRQVLQALVYLHARGVIHRDLKAANILLNRRGDVKLADFGVAAVMSDTDKHFTIVGSPYWMAPEIIQATGHSTLSDIWSLGCTVIELLTGEPPYFGLNPMTAMFKIVQTAAPIPPGLSPTMHEFLGLCFRKDPEQRPPASELLNHPLFQRPDVPESVDIASIMGKTAHPAQAEVVVSTQQQQQAPPPLPAAPEAPGSSPATAKHSATYARRRLKERRDSRLAIPAYKIERENDTGPEPPPDADEDNFSDSESSTSSTSSNSGRGRVSMDEARRPPLPSRPSAGPQQRSSKGGPFASLGRQSGGAKPLSEISITVDKNVVFGVDTRQRHRPTQSARQPGAKSPDLPSDGSLHPSDAVSSSVPREHSGNLPHALSPAGTHPSGRVPSSARFKTLPKGGVDGLSKEEAMELEIESLKMMLMKTQVEDEEGDEAGDSVPDDGGTVLSTRVSMLKELVPSSVALPPQIGTVSSMQIINDVLWIGGMTGSVLAYSLPRFSLLSSARLHKTRINSIIRVGSTRIFCSSEEGEVYVFPPKDPSRAKHHTAHDAEHCAIKALLYLDGDRPRVWSCAVSRNNTQITVMNKRCEIKYKLTLMANLCCATISPTRETCWFGCSNSTILVCDAVHGDLRREIVIPGESSNKVSVHAMLSVGDLIWCASGSKIYVYDPFGFTVEKTLSASASATIESLALFESVVIAGTSSGTVECFDSISMAHIMTLPLVRTGSASSASPVAALAAVPGSLLTGRTGVPALFAVPTSSSTLSQWSTPPASGR